MPGWQNETQNSSSKPDSPGYTDEQQQVTDLRRRLADLSAAVITHEFWEGLDDVVAARMALKQTAHNSPVESREAGQAPTP
ncbi:nucleic acid-binding protein [Streptomyces paludis]|uniref:Nucleic acid-binding protein n=1 Tax=Streptomyces paludis TaxID=2282738 RepID=A0A345HYX6_9ACTN|nr:nucleic acid-binding protein [Streptomyces paludis]AXG81900.1 nucleic acid-binding protein [Streptomyces paludis]